MSGFLTAVSPLLVTLQVMWFAAGKTAIGQGVPWVCSRKSVTDIVCCMCRKDKPHTRAWCTWLDKIVYGA